MNRKLLDTKPLCNPIRQKNMRRVESLLMDGELHNISEELCIEKRQVQRINKDLNFVYEDDNAVCCVRNNKNVCLYKLSNTSKIIFTETLFESKSREYMLALYQLIVNIGQTLPTYGILGDGICNSYDCFKGKIDMGSASDKVKRNIVLLYQPLMNEKNVLIEYKNQNGKLVKFELSPYCVKAYNNKWYLFGYKLIAGGNSNEWDIFDLNLVENIEESKSGRRFKPCKTDLNEYYNGMIGFFSYKDPHTNKHKSLEQVRDEIQIVEFRIADPMVKDCSKCIQLKKLWGKYIESNPLHKSQKTIYEDTEGNKTFTISVNVSPNLINRLRFYGAEIEVLKPVELRRTMKKESEKLFNIYNKYN